MRTSIFDKIVNCSVDSGLLSFIFMGGIGSMMGDISFSHTQTARWKAEHERHIAEHERHMAAHNLWRAENGLPNYEHERSKFKHSVYNAEHAEVASNNYSFQPSLVHLLVASQIIGIKDLTPILAGYVVGQAIGRTSEPSSTNYISSSQHTSDDESRFKPK